MVETLAIAAVVTFSLGCGVALAPAVALNRSKRSDQPKASRRKRSGSRTFFRPRRAALDPTEHAPAGLAPDRTRGSTLRHRSGKHEL